MPHRVLPLLAATMLLAGCGADEGPPKVTFAVGEASVVAGPTQYCDLALTDCRNDAAAPVQLRVAPGSPLRIEVPDEIAETPWQVIFTYRDSAGAQTDGRSSVLAPNEHSDYALELPAPTDRLLTAQVQQYGPPPQENEQTGEIEFPIRASWVLTATP